MADLVLPNMPPDRTKAQNVRTELLFSVMQERLSVTYVSAGM